MNDKKCRIKPITRLKLKENIVLFICVTEESARSRWGRKHRRQALNPLLKIMPILGKNIWLAPGSIHS